MSNDKGAYQTNPLKSVMIKIELLTLLLNADSKRKIAS